MTSDTPDFAGNGAPKPPAEAQHCTCPSGDGSLRWPCPAPVGVEALQSMRDRMMTALPPKFGDAFDGDFDTLLEAINALKGGRRQNLAALAQQPAAVDEAMVDRFIRKYQELEPGDDVPAVDDPETRRFAETLLTAALAAQPGGSENG